MYQPYVIQDDKLSNFLEEFKSAIENNKINLQWPSGKIVEISSVRSVSSMIMCRSTQVRYQSEHRNQASRAALLPNLCILDPKVQNTPVDKLIDDLRVQDKAGEKQRGQAWNVTLRKQAGKISGKQTSQPYHRDDFDVLWVFIPGDRSFFVIPMSKLIENEVVANDESPGKKSLLVHLPTSTRRSANGDKWTQKYCFDVEDPAIQTKIQNHLNDIKKGINESN